MVLKIATGRKKGITLSSTKNARELRPTQALVREALINTLGSLLGDFSEIKALDLYAGIGTMGFELLSNDAAFVAFVERDKNCIRALKENIRNLNYKDQTLILPKAVLAGIKNLAKTIESRGAFNLIFADPPYKSNDFEDLTREIIENDLLEKDGILIWECSDEKLINRGIHKGLELIKEKKYGDTFIYIFQKLF